MKRELWKGGPVQGPAAKNEMEKELMEIRRENERLRHLADMDRLTEVYNRCAAEEKINERIEEYQCGVLLVLDVDHFKKVNDWYGHLVGDILLQQIALSLQGMFLKTDIIGRVGGDEFVVFLSVDQGEDFAKARARQVKERFRTIDVQSYRLNISVSLGCSAYRKGDNYKSLFDRADKNLMEEKRKRKKKESSSDPLGRSIEMDILRIQSELRERQEVRGAYLQEYQAFKQIYRFVERRLQRMETSSYIVLVTLTDSQSKVLSLEENLKWMKMLEEIIVSQLRAGDTVTQYSSCQYLIMLADVQASEAETVVERIKRCFYGQAGGDEQEVLVHSCYPLQGSKDPGRVEKSG